jgi:hypothetical protein
MMPMKVYAALNLEAEPAISPALHEPALLPPDVGANARRLSELSGCPVDGAARRDKASVYHSTVPAAPLAQAGAAVQGRIVAEGIHPRIDL